jgi:hypothetical protein
MICDGCGQAASTEHITRRLQRLEWSTRYRPVHIQTLLLSAAAPAENNAFLYAEATPLKGEAAQLLDLLQITWEGKPPDSFLGEFQRRGLFLMHLLECSVEQARLAEGGLQSLLERHLTLGMARIRRSLRPKRVALVSPELLPLAGKLTEAALGCPLLLDLKEGLTALEVGRTRAM